MIIGLCGNKRAGKDTVADIIVNRAGFKKLAFATALRTFLADTFDISYDYLNNQELKEVPFTNPIVIDASIISKIIKYCSNYTTIDYKKEMDVYDVAYNKVINTPRELMQFIATDLIRNKINDSFWTDQVKYQLERYGNYVISDVRFQNERDLIKKEFKGLLVYINRPCNENKDGHISENDVGDMSQYDVIINNDGTMTSLMSDVSLWLNLKGFTK